MLLGIAAVVWVTAYQLNLRWWNWWSTALPDCGEERAGDSVHFFFFDVTKIALLLTGIIFVVTVCGASCRSNAPGRCWAGDGRIGNVLAAASVW